MRWYEFPNLWPRSKKSFSKVDPIFSVVFDNYSKNYSGKYASGLKFLCAGYGRTGIPERNTRLILGVRFGGLGPSNAAQNCPFFTLCLRLPQARLSCAGRNICTRFVSAGHAPAVGEKIISISLGTARQRAPNMTSFLPFLAYLCRLATLVSYIGFLPPTYNRGSLGL